MTRAGWTGTGRVAALLLAGLIALGSGLVGAGTAVAGGAVAATGSPRADPAVTGLASCLQGQKSGDLLLLIDDSKSLKSTDPQAARVQAATYMLTQLSGLTERAKVHLDVAIAGFSDDFKLSAGWTTLSGATVPELTADVESFRSQDSGFDTDYWSALEGARRALGDRAAARSGAAPESSGRCQAIAWFTDGQLDLEPRDTSDEAQRFGTTKPFAPGVSLTDRNGATAAQQRAVDSLCRNGGLADSLRASHITIFAVGLAAGGTSPTEFGLLRSIATGQPQSDGSACGAQVDPVPGTFQLASDIDSLLFAFDTIIPPDVTTSAGVCTGTATGCQEKHQFVLDRSIDGVHILASVDPPAGVKVQLVDPSGAVTSLDTHDIGRTIPSDVRGVSTSYVWQSDRTVAVDLTVDPGGSSRWAGPWSLVFVDPTTAASTARSRSNIHIWGNLQPGWTNQNDAPLRSGSTVPDVRLGLVDASGAPVDASTLLGFASLSAALVDHDQHQTSVLTGVDKDRIGSPVTLDLTSVPPGGATLRLTLALTTADATAPDGTRVPGTQLTPEVLSIPLMVQPPLGFPQLGSRIDFGIADNTTTLDATLPITGPGCVWVADGARPTLSSAPDGLSDIAVGAPSAGSGATCVAVEDGRTGSLPLHLAAPTTGSGTVTGTVPVTTSPLNDHANTRTVDVAFTADMRRPPNPVNFVLALVAALLLGPGIPLGLLYLAKWVTARIPDAPLSARRIPVTVDGHRVLRGPSDFVVGDADFVEMVPMPAGGARRLEVDGVVLRSRIGWSPLRAGFVSAAVPFTAEAPVAAASSTDPQPHGARLEARLPLAVHNKWVVVHELLGAPEQASVLMLVGADSTAQQRAELAEDVRARLPEVLARLRAQTGGPDSLPPLAPVGGPLGPPPGPGHAGPNPPPGTSPFDFPG